MNEEYADIIHLPHPTSKTHPRMSLYNRAAQFAPFAALVGHEALIEEAARETDTLPEYDDERNRLLNRQMLRLRESLSLEPICSFTFFEPDEKKSGGTYRILTGIVKKIDDFEQVIYLDTGDKIPIHAIFDIQCEDFEDDDNSYP